MSVSMLLAKEYIRINDLFVSSGFGMIVKSITIRNRKFCSGVLAMSSKYVLRHPIEHDGKVIRELSFRRLAMADMMVAMKQVGNQAELGFVLLLMSVGIELKVLERMDLADFIQCQVVLAEHLGVPVPGFANPD